MTTNNHETADMGGGDLPADNTTPAVLTLDTPVTGTIGADGDSDWYAITLEAGQTYWISLDSASGSILDPSVAIWTNFVLAADTNNGIGNNAFVTFTPSATGTYYVAAQGVPGTSGDYEVLVRKAPVDDFPGTDSTALALDATVTGVINGQSDQDRFSVSLQEGHTYVVTLTGNGSGHLPDYYGALSIGGTFFLYGTTSGNASYGNLGHLVFRAGATGTADITINTGWFGSPDNVAGAYSLTIHEAPAEEGSDRATATAATLGVTEGYFIARADTYAADDWYAFDLTAGQTYVLRNIAGEMQTSLYATDGALIAGYGYNTGRDTLVFTPTAGGTYYLSLHSQYLDVSSYHSISVTADTDLAANATTTGAVAIGGSAAGISGGAGDVDWFAVDVVAGTTYAFGVSGAFNTGLTPHLELVDAGGGVLASDDHSGAGYDSQIVFTASQTGRLYLAASLNAPGATASGYTISAAVVTDDVGSSAAGAQALTLGQDFSGTINYASDQDWFSVVLQAGSVYEAAGTNMSIRNAAGDILYSSANGVLHFTSSLSGSAYLVADGNDSNSTFTYNARLSLLDRISDSVATTARIAVGQTLAGVINYGWGSISTSADSDWYGITLDAGQSYRFKAAPGASNGVTPTVTLHDATGGYLDSNYSGGWLYFTAATGGQYYVEATFGNAGNYTLTTGLWSAPSPTFEIGGSSSSGVYLPIGETIHSSIEVNGDQDWYEVHLVAGEHYAFTVTQDGATPLSDCYVTLYDAYGGKRGSDDDGGASWPNSLLRYTADRTGTYYVAASGWETATGNYTVGAQKIPNQDPLATIDWGSQIADNQVTVYFATGGETWIEHTADRSWTATESQAFMRACQTWSRYTNLTFSQTSSAAGADMIVVIDDLDGNLAGFMQTPPGTPQVGVFDPYWNTNTPAEGSVWFATFIHEVGHFLGLAHPHDTGGDSQIMEGVYDDDQRGTYDLNQAVYTVMSYNTGYMGQYTATSGNPETPMALDIAVVQRDYGSHDRNGGDTVYDVNSPKGYELIWDTGGIDTLMATFSTALTLDLRAATLLNEVGGGGYVSRDSGGYTGYTIAHGVVIENATGGTGSDILIGNEADNVLRGQAGNDTLYGSAGADQLIGGDGADTATFILAQGVNVSLAVVAAQAQTFGSVTLSGIESLVGSKYNDVLTGDAGVNYLDGGEGNDELHGTGNDTLNGGSGDDSYYLDVAGDFIADYQGFNTLYAAFDVTNYAYTGISAIVLTGNALTATVISGVYPYALVTGNGMANTLTTGSGNDRLDGGAGADRLVGGDGSDTYFVDDAGDVLVETWFGGVDTVRTQVSYDIGATFVENMELMGANGLAGYGNALDNSLTGNAAANRLEGRAGNDRLDGGLGVDTLVGGLGNDSYWLDSASDLVVEAANQGNDSVYVAFSYNLTANVEAAILSGGGAFNLTGSAVNNRLTGNDAANRLDGGLGADTLAGGLGDDTYVIDNAGDVIVELAGQGTELVQAAISYALAATLENLTLTGSGLVNATGNATANILTGNVNSNLLDGLGGADTMIGGLGNDSYIIDNIGDTVTELASQGLDTILTGLTWTLAANVERLTLTGTANVYATGNELANQITGNAGNNRLDGGLGADTLIGGLGNDVYTVDDIGDRVAEALNEGLDLVNSSVTYILGSNIENLQLLGMADLNGTGNGLNNVIWGTSGANLLDGAAGADKLLGGLGNDTYIIDNSSDKAEDVADGGIDIVFASQSHILNQYVENLTLTGSANITATGNAMDNILIGNAGNNRLTGGTGMDAMTGGAGHDTYYVDNIGDTVTEGLNAGIDLVQSTVTFTLSDNVENLFLNGTGDLNGTGNAINNLITGTAGNNILDGQGGVDKLFGGLGDDTYYLDNASDSAKDEINGGHDIVYSSASWVATAYIEDLFLTGSANITGTGNALANILSGNEGNNKLDGGTGNDILSGGLGNDTFVFSAASGVDTITDFTTSDYLSLKAYSHGVKFGGGVTVTQNGADVVVDLGGGNTVTVLNSLQADVASHIFW